MELNLAGKIIVVTGATANIGRAIAMDFADEGAKLVAASFITGQIFTVDGGMLL